MARKNSILFFFVVAAMIGKSFACTVPVFRYALDRWPGKPGEESVESPVLDEIANRILSGDSAVWIQVDSGNQSKDEAAFKRLESRLQFFQSVAELPEIDPNDPSSQLGPGPDLELKFSTMRIPRNHPIVKNLTGPELEALPSDEAWIAPVFGRGRVLGAWPASLMDEQGIDEACFYLTGACSCQVKAQNPGWDLPMNVDWQARLWKIGEGVIEEESTAELDISSYPMKNTPMAWIFALLAFTTGAAILSTKSASVL